MAEQYSALAATLEREIREGVRPVGSRLPTVRRLADETGLSPGTVAAAFRVLRDRGLIVTDGRRGTLVRGRPPVTVRGVAAVPSGARDLTYGSPDPALLPPVPVGALQIQPRGYTDGDPPQRLLDLASTRFAADGIDVPAITVVSGALDGVERALLAHLAPGDRVAVEDPGYANLLDLLPALGMAAVPVRMDAAGMLPDALDAAVHAGVRAVVVTPRAQNPTGAALDAERAGQLAAVLATTPRDTLLIEDDHAAGIAGAPAVTLTNGYHGPWALVRSVSKAYGPDLRVALLAGDETTVSRVEGRMRLGAGWVSGLLVDAVTALWTDPQVGALLARATTTYASRRGALVDALAGHGIRAQAPSGYNVWVPLDTGGPDGYGTGSPGGGRDAVESTAVTGLLARRWAVAAGARFRIRSGPGLRITTSTLDEADAVRFAADLAQVLHPVRGRGLPAAGV
jgi:DNA-binding transcriptional MocR family regulator